MSRVFQVKPKSTIRSNGNDYSKARWSSWDFEVKELGKC